MGDDDSVFPLQSGLYLLPQGGFLGGIELLPLFMIQVILHLLANGFQLVGGDAHILDGDEKRRSSLTQIGYRKPPRTGQTTQPQPRGEFFLNIH